MYNQEYCQYVYDYFNKDFFQAELHTTLGKCTIFTNKKDDAKKVFGDYLSRDGNDPYGLSVTLLGHNYIWINPLLLNSKKILVNTILHEMIRIYVNSVRNNGIRRYREGHGKLWTQTAKLAQQLYGHELGNIQRYSTQEEQKKFDYYHDMKSTKSLVNAYLVKLISGDLVPLKNLTPEQLTVLQGMDIIGIYQVKPKIQQVPGKRVTRFISWETLLDCIENGIDYETEEVCGHLRIKIGEDTDTVWLKHRR